MSYRFFLPMKRGAILVGLLILGFVMAVAAHDDTELTTTRLSDTIYLISGKGGNVGVSVGEDGTFLIDDKFAPMTKDILRAIEAIHGAIPTFVINTHWHGDHTGGNENLGKAGAIIVAQDNVRKRLSQDNVIAAFDIKTTALSKDGLPSITFANKMTLYMNGDTVELNHVANAHTDGDSIVYFKQANIIHTGDIFFNGFYPFIDTDHGGSLKGMIAAADMVLAIADDKTQIIPGHGPMATKADLVNYRDMLSTVYKRLIVLKQQGKSLDDAILARPLQSLDAEWSDGLFTTDKWISLIYPSLQ